MKHGYGKVTDHVCREIRLKRLTREEGIELIRNYVTRGPENLSLFLDWIGMKESAFKFIINLHRNSQIWQRNNNWEWELKTDLLPKGEDLEEIEKQRLGKTEDCNFIITESKRPSYKDDHYILIGKGYYNEENIKTV